jgi:histone deacetylase complex regulatory component SIN3
MDNETPQHPQEQLYSLYPNVFPPTTSSSTSSSHDDDVQPEHPAAASEDALPPDDAQDEDAFERNLREKPKTSALTIKDSLAYLTTIKTVFQDKPEVYAQFLDVMNAFKMRT